MTSSRGRVRPLGVGIALATVSLACLGCDKPDDAVRWRGVKVFADPKVTALAKAVEHSDLEEIDRLVNEGIDVNARGRHDITPLIWAIMNERKDSLRRLLKHGADPNVSFKGSSSAMGMAAEMPADSEYLELLLEHGGDPNLVDSGDRETPIFAAIASRDKKNLDRLIQAGADINHQDDFGNTPIIYAAMMNWFDSVYYLLEAGADYKIKSKYGGNLIDEVADQSVGPYCDPDPWRDKVIAFLEKKGVDFEPAMKKAAKDLEEVLKRVRESRGEE